MKISILLLSLLTTCLSITGCQHGGSNGDPINSNTVQHSKGMTGLNPEAFESSDFEYKLDTEMFDLVAHQLMRSLPRESTIAVSPFLSEKHRIDKVTRERINDKLKRSLRDQNSGLEFVDRKALPEIHEEWQQSGLNSNSSDSVRLLGDKTVADYLLIGRGYTAGSTLCIRYELFDLSTTRSAAGSSEHCQYFRSQKTILIGQFTNWQGLDAPSLQSFATSIFPISQKFRLIINPVDGALYDYTLTGKLIEMKVKRDNNQIDRARAKKYGVDIIDQAIWSEVKYQTSLESNFGEPSILKIGYSFQKISSVSEAKSTFNDLTTKALRSAIKKLTNEILANDGV
jgi:hypothetical protein